MVVSYRYRLALAFLACTATGANRAMAADLWLEDPITGCQVWTDEIDPAGEIVSWTGDCLDGKATGKGVLVWFKGGSLLGRYEGPMAWGRLHGSGVLYYQAKEGYDRFEGDFVAGELHGNLILDRANGEHFEGTVETDGTQAEGAFFNAAGERYEGTFKDGLYDGHGVLIEVNGDRYEGGFKQGKPHGKGFLDGADGSHFEGEFKDGQPIGRATYTSADGTVYEGEYVNGLVEGTVVVTYPDGRKENQLWKGGKPVEQAEKKAEGTS